MSILIGIAGPSCTGKTKLMESLKDNCSKVFPNSKLYFSEDIKDYTWNKLVEETSLSQWEEVYADKDYLLMYCFRMISEYEKLLESLRESDYDYCFIDTTYLDLLIYCQLHFWYHYPSYDLLTEMVNRILDLKDKIDIIYMTVADDVVYKPETKDLRQRMSDFKNNRSIELKYYSIYRDLPNVVSVSTNVKDSTEMIIPDIFGRFCIKREGEESHE